MSVYEDMAEMIRLGAYRRGSDPLVDEAILYQPQLEQFLSQHKALAADIGGGFQALRTILDGKPAAGDGK
jgi:flagellum-specific ATP synthase